VISGAARLFRAFHVRFTLLVLDEFSILSTRESRLQAQKSSQNPSPQKLFLIQI
jgi:hypothetical protein